ncbi:hypothetical protein RAK27_11730 [Carnobacterium maltaromaticum]|uniref:Phage protein n=1 Tax=Carnobacterium maltaromaticum TaxID=2751 RepID=A0AAW9JUU9_CARML|nr:hypothetical protein [Carnobacterium maltaromaticum]MDZ5759333.1 hypothetical protein [Carnobacterium maltaromaticum]
MATDIYQLNFKNTAGALLPFFPVSHQKAIINAMAEKAILVTNTQTISASGYYQYTAATTNLPAGLPAVGYISAAFLDSKNGQLAILGTTWSRLMINSVWSAWVNSNAESDSGWIKAITSGVTHDSGKPLQYRKIGNKVMFRGGGTFPTAAGTTFLVLPGGFSPIGQNAFFDTTVRDSNPQHKCIVQVLTSSECKIITNSYSANPIFLDGFEYLTI